MFLPTDVANRALDAAGVGLVLGDIEEGTKEAQICLRSYKECLMQLLRAVHWDFARKQAPLVLLGDATGQTQNVGNLVAYPWSYCYAYPTDCMKARFVPWSPFLIPPVPSGNIAIAAPTGAQTGAPGNSPFYGQRLRPARFVVGTDFNYPPPPGSITWEVQGVSPECRTVINTNVPQAVLVYTALILHPSVWDPLFRAAMVAYLSSEIAFPLHADKKLGMAVRAQQITLAKEKISQARVSDGNEGTPSTDISVDWMRFRNSGGGAWGGSRDMDGAGPGVLGYGCDGLSLADGSVF